MEQSKQNNSDFQRLYRRFDRMLKTLLIYD